MFPHTLRIAESALKDCMPLNIFLLIKADKEIVTAKIDWFTKNQILFVLFFFSINEFRVSAPHVCICLRRCPQRPEGISYGTLKTTSCGCWKHNPSPLQEQ